VNKIVKIKRWGYHLHHSAIAMLSTLVLKEFMPLLIAVILSGTVFLFIKKFFFERPSDWQTWSMYLKDLFTDWVEYQAVWLLYFSGIYFGIVLGVILITYYIFAIKLNWSYP